MAFIINLFLKNRFWISSKQFLIRNLSQTSSVTLIHLVGIPLIRSWGFFKLNILKSKLNNFKVNLDNLFKKNMRFTKIINKFRTIVKRCFKACGVPWTQVPKAIQKVFNHEKWRMIFVEDKSEFKIFSKYLFYELCCMIIISVIYC